MLFTLESLVCAGCIPSVIHARFKHLELDDLAAFFWLWLARCFDELQATFPFTLAHSLGRRI